MQDFEVEFPISPSDSPRLGHVHERLLARQQELEGMLEDKPDDPAARRARGRVEVALSWVKAGLYGTCTVCGDPLPTVQLEHDPTDMVCTDCREASARSRRRHVRTRVDARPLSLVDGPEALTRGFARASVLAQE